MLNHVVENKKCIGCGACAFAFSDVLQMGMSTEGHWVPFARNASGPSTEKTLSGLPKDAARICPMSGAGKDEDYIAEEKFPGIPKNDQIGKYLRTFAGCVTSENERAAAGSGGLITWLCKKLIVTQEVSAVVHVRPTYQEVEAGVLFEYAISYTSDEVSDGAKSRYYPVELSKVLSKIAESDDNYAVVGLPCTIKALKLLEYEGYIAPGQIKYTIGLVCGHLKSKYFSEYLAYQIGGNPSKTYYADFRHKFYNEPASYYGFRSEETDSDNSMASPMKALSGHDWGEGLFKNPACEFCDDVLAECADICLGDAWLPSYVNDWRGHNIGVVRSQKIASLLDSGEKEGRLSLTDVSVGQVIQSQSAGLRHRREGLAHRLAVEESEASWVPKKRISPKFAATRQRRKIYNLRYRIALESSALYFMATRRGNIAEFETAIRPLLKKYRLASTGGLRSRLKRAVRRRLSKFLGGRKGS